MWENASAGSSQNTLGRRFPWLWFFLVLVAPAILNFVLALFAANSNEAVTLILGLTFVGSLAAGIASAILLVRWKKGELSSAGVPSVFAFSILFSVVSFALCFAGCAAGFTLSSK